MRDDLVEAGLTASAVDMMVRRSRLHPFVGQGAYLVGHPEPPPLAREYAALRLGGPRSVLSHRTAAALWEFVPAQTRIHLSLDAQRRSTATVAFHRATLMRREVRTLHGDVRVTSPARTIADLAPHLAPDQLERIVADAIRRRLATEREIARYATASRRGARKLRAVLQLDGGPQWTRSKAEQEFLKLVREAGLPAPKMNRRSGGKERDAVWEAHRVVAEIDGRSTHGFDPVSFEADRRRDNERIARGWLPLRFTWARLRNDRLAIAAELSAVLNLRALPD